MHSKVALQLQRVSSPVECLGSGLSGALTKQDSLELAEGISQVFYPTGAVFFLEGQTASFSSAVAE